MMHKTLDFPAFYVWHCMTAMLWLYALTVVKYLAKSVLFFCLHNSVCLSQMPDADSGSAIITLPAVPKVLQSEHTPFKVANSKDVNSSDDRVVVMSLVEALQLAGSKPLDVLIAGQHVEAAARRYDHAKVMWLPNIMLGGDYFHHEGRQQNFAGDILKSSRSTVMGGFGPNVLFSFSDALFNPKITAQELSARRSLQVASMNDVTVSVTDAYFEIQRARCDFLGAQLALKHAEELNRRTVALAQGTIPPLEATRSRVELARRKQSATIAKEKWRIASAELARILRLDPLAFVEPAESPYMTISLIQDQATVDSLIPIALQNRPELAAHQAIVQAALTRLKQEKLRPLLPSLAIRSTSTNPSGSLGYGTFAGGAGGKIGDPGQRFDIDLQLMWEFSHLGFGNKAKQGERNAEHMTATLELFRTQDRIAAEVAVEFAKLKSARERMIECEPMLKDSIDLVEKSMLGLSQIRRVGEMNMLVVRPQEVVAAVQSLGQSIIDYSSAITDYNKSQFRLYRAIGHPAASLPDAIPAMITIPAAPPALQR